MAGEEIRTIMMVAMVVSNTVDKIVSVVAMEVALAPMLATVAMAVTAVAAMEVAPLSSKVGAEVVVSIADRAQVLVANGEVTIKVFKANITLGRTVSLMVRKKMTREAMTVVVTGVEAVALGMSM